MRRWRNDAMMLALLTVPGLASAQSTGRILTQPARDVGLSKDRIAAILVRAREAPYTRAGTRTCGQIAREIAALTRAIGPDFNGSASANKRNLAKVGGAAVVNSLIPFRGLVREVSGANARAERRRAAVAAGIARRGFLRGLQSAQGCRA